MCGIGGEPPSAYWETMPIARKQHKCCECGSDIDPGEKYRKISGIWEGEFAIYKQCELCADAFDDANSHFHYDDERIAFTCLWEYLGME